MKNEIFTAWITKYALTNGIEAVQAEWCGDVSAEMITYGYGDGYMHFVHGSDWHRTPEAALARAEEMRTAKIASLKNSMAKLERMTFVAPKEKK